MRRSIQFCLAVFVAALFMSFAASALADDAKGKLRAVYPDKQEFVMADNQGKDITFHVIPDAKVLINNKEAKLGDLLPGEEVSVRFDRQMEMPMASEIRCKRD